MTPERWQQIKDTFHAALERAPNERTRFLDEACRADDPLRKEIESLIRASEETGKLIDAPAYEALAELAADGQELVAGETIGHYSIVSALGKGGMGEVYLARDRRLRRNVAIKLLPSYFAKDSARLRRFEQEARAASALNHPNILTIYEIGETDSTRFIVTEFIDGLTLRQRMVQSPLDLHESLDIAIHVASALVAAHRVQIVHRDIKPENIMVRREDGLVKLLDFGLAKATEKPNATVPDPEAPTRALVNTAPGVVMGTVAYMSPEQARGLAVDGRTDIWSVGVVLYEMIAGKVPFAGTGANEIISAILSKERPAALARFTHNLPPELDRIITKALIKDREERYQTTKDFLIDLKRLKQKLEVDAEVERIVAPETRADGASTTASAQTGTAGHSTSSAEYFVTEIKRHQGAVLLALAVILIAGAALSYFLYFKSNRTPALTDKDTVLLADFVNTTGEAVFDGTLKQGLAVQLRQTPFLNLFPEEGVRETLRYMGREPEERVTRPIGREICQRQGLKAMIIGTIASLGRNYVITLEAVSGQTGEVIASEQVEAAGQEHVLGALGHAGNNLRRKLGESLSTLQKYNAPIEQATTSSLEALQAYSVGLDKFLQGDMRDALPFFNRAIELDPNFAAAYDWRAWNYSELGDSDNATKSAEKAFSLRDRVTGFQKLSIDITYYHYVTGELDKQIEVDESWQRLYPNSWMGPHDLGVTYGFMGMFEKAISKQREALHLNPNVVHTFRFLSNYFMRLNRFDEARDIIKQAQAQKLDAFYFHRNLYMMAFAQADQNLMREQLDWMTKQGKDGESEALLWQARAAAFAGHRREALTQYLHAAELRHKPGAADQATVLPPEASLREPLFGFCKPVDQAATLSLSRIVSPVQQIVNVAILSDGSLCGDVGEAQKFADALAKRYPRATLINGVSLPIIRGAIALRRHQPAQALEVLRPAIPFEAVDFYWSTYLRGQAYLRLGKGSEADAEFQKILDHRGWDPISALYPLAHLGLARAMALTSDVTGSRKEYQDFFALWKDADNDLPILIEAKKEYEKLK